MAGDWIKVEKATVRKPEISALARLLGIPRHAALGLMLEFWCWIDEVAVDGVVDACVDADVDATFATPGLARALEIVNWLRFERTSELTGRAIVPNADRHFGKSSKERALKSGRQAKWRAKSVDAVVDGHVDATPSTREEKKREETTTSKAKTVAATPLPGWLDQTAWQRFLEARLAMKAKATPHAQTLLLRELEALRAKGHDPTAVLDQSVARGWRGLFPVKPDGTNGKATHRNAFADAIIGAVSHGQRQEAADPRDISGEAERVA